MGANPDPLGRGLRGDTAEPPFNPQSQSFGTYPDPWENIPATSMYLHLDDQLRVLVGDQGGGQNYGVRLRILKLDGNIYVHDRTFLNVNSAGGTFFQEPLVEGWLLSAAIRRIGSTGVHNSGFAVVMIARGSLANPIEVATLISGCPTSDYTLGWPYPKQQDTTDGAGIIQNQTVGNPAAGADWTYSVPAGRRIRLQSIQATLITSATAATRGVRIVITDGLNQVAQIPANSTQIASLTNVYNIGNYPFATTAIVGELFVPLPSNLYLTGAFQIKAVTNNIQAGDQWSGIAVQVEQWFDPL